MTVTIWHNPRCSKSRQTLALLTERGIEPAVVEYLKTPPSVDEIADALKQLGIGARDLMRHKEAPFRDLGLGDPSVPETTLVEAMASHPILIERPVVFSGGKAAIGRPPEAVLEIL